MPRSSAPFITNASALFFFPPPRKNLDHPRHGARACAAAAFCMNESREKKPRGNQNDPENGCGKYRNDSVGRKNRPIDANILVAGDFSCPTHKND
jgi:hypothetical protein